MNSVTATAVAACVLVVLAASGAGIVTGEQPRPAPTAPRPAAEGTVGPAEPNGNETVPSDPETDVLGWENGYWYNETVEVNQTDGLTAAETEAYLSRAMARVEYIRQLEFTRDVEVEVIPREEFANQSGEFTGGATSEYWQWNDQVWEGLFIVGEDEDVQDAFDNLTGGGVLGYYDPVTDELVVVSDSPGAPVIDNATLIHELVHAIQDQRYDIAQPKYEGVTQDEQLAVGGLIEGEATLVEERYARLCREEWNCVATPRGERSDRPPTYNVGILITLLNQYSDGMAYLHALVEGFGWEIVDLLYEDPPDSTEQVIHVEPGEDPVPIEFEDAARNGWELFPAQGENGSDTVGEASIYAMFWYQAYRYDIPIVNQSAFSRPDRGPYDLYNYTSAPSAGWANDRLFPYRKDGRFGYVWVTEWDTEADARGFHEAYEAMLTGHGATRTGNDTWVVGDGPYADAFHVERNGTAVTVVNGPTVDDLHDIRPGADAERRSRGGVNGST